MTELDVSDAGFEAFEDGAANPALVEAAQAITSGETASEPPELEEPLDGPVDLVAGFRRVRVGEGERFEVVRRAWVRELNGEDEERIAKVRMGEDSNAFINTVLTAGVERLGDSAPTREDFDSMVLGDRDYLMMEIARATYGDTLAYDKVVCPHCSEEFDVELSISEDIPVKRLEKPEDAEFEVRLRKDRVATVYLPTVEATAGLPDAASVAEINTILVAAAVQEIRGPKGTVQIAGDKDAARRLGIVDRQTLVDAMGDRMPGPKYNEVRFKHEPGCGEEVRLTVTMADLFHGM